MSLAINDFLLCDWKTSSVKSKMGVRWCSQMEMSFGADWYGWIPRLPGMLPAPSIHTNPKETHTTPIRVSRIMRIYYFNPAWVREHSMTLSPHSRAVCQTWPCYACVLTKLTPKPSYLFFQENNYEWQALFKRLGSLTTLVALKISIGPFKIVETFKVTPTTGGYEGRVPVIKFRVITILHISLVFFFLLAWISLYGLFHLLYVLVVLISSTHGVVSYLQFWGL